MFKLFSSSKSKKSPYGWFGNYSNWDDLMNSVDGYSSVNILNKTKDALLQVKEGTAVYERDSVLFDQIIHPFPLLTCLFKSAATLKRPLHIIDFGGSLGSTYFQTKHLLGNDICASWNIVEQEHYVAAGKEHFEDDHLKFFSSIEACLQVQKIDLILLSGSVQYLPEPHLFLEKLAGYNFDFIVFDRTAFHQGKQDRLTLQIVPPEIYKAAYPAWFFHEESFLNHFISDYTIMCDFTSYVAGESLMDIDHQPVGYDKGFYLVQKSRYA
ncbi:putative methyltransferase (TIGR04325 family) [Pedobacter cryoconitis]|uniref:Putative methyltransferase (TIGR04325 family) n=1 Tax=Pedobacter cryoconitis TaxID=188932 RepID=A0A7W8ZHT1_9SPHI|nr:methyltransferase, TIGR04325 family [Pedobacter cryoconitis]MBB5634173.1 putative methyltransferase (TIGR04325 family) [Pedobacter cryoconitis]